MVYQIPDHKLENKTLRKEKQLLLEENELLKQKLEQGSFAARLRERFSRDEFLKNTSPKILLLIMAITWLVIMGVVCEEIRDANIKEKQEMQEACSRRCGGAERLVETSYSRGAYYCLCDTEDNGLVEMPAVLRIDNE